MYDMRSKLHCPCSIIMPSDAKGNGHGHQPENNRAPTKDVVANTASKGTNEVVEMEGEGPNQWHGWLSGKMGWTRLRLTKNVYMHKCNNLVKYSWA